MCRYLYSGAVFLFAFAALATPVHWDGEANDGLWSNPRNWSNDMLPKVGDSVVIERERVVYDVATDNGNLPAGLSIWLKQGAELSVAKVIRLYDAYLSVESGCCLSGGSWWDLDGGTLEFEDGAIVDVNEWEQKDLNHFKFKLGPQGFRPLTPRRVNLGHGSLAASMKNITFTVDMAAYKGGSQTIVLFDFFRNDCGIDARNFEAVSVNIVNAGKYQVSLQWNDKTDAVELVVLGPAQAETLGFLTL